MAKELFEFPEGMKKISDLWMPSIDTEYHKKSKLFYIIPIDAKLERC